MHDRHLSPLQVAAALHGAALRLERLGVERRSAIRAVAVVNGLAPGQVEQAIALVAPLQPQSRWHR